MKIQEVGQKTSLDHATIRFYEKEGLFTPERQENGYRCYTQENVDLLNKTKLLRQLGISRHKIKLLQQGEESLSDVLDKQIQLLEKQIKNDLQARAVCQAMKHNGVDYYNLDTQMYWAMLQCCMPAGSQPYAEHVERPFHPWRHHIARVLDTAIATVLLYFFYFTVFRVRTYNGSISVLFSYMGYIARDPFGSFTAKPIRYNDRQDRHVMGIRVENAAIFCLWLICREVPVLYLTTSQI